MVASNDLLAAFSVDALAGAPGAAGRARRAIDGFLFEHRHSPLGATAALCELRDAFDGMRIESAAARSIGGEIDARLHEIVRDMQSVRTGRTPPALPA